MPSPIAHSFIGLSIYLFFTHKNQLFKNWKIIIFSLFLVVLPDFDFILVFITNNPFAHRTFSHSLLFSIMVAFIVSKYKIIDFGSKRRIFLYSFCLVFSHPMADFFVHDGLYPSKVAIFFPFGDMINSPVSLFDPINWAKKELFFSMETLLALIKELLITAPLFLLIYFSKKRMSHD